MSDDLHLRLLRRVARRARRDADTGRHDEASGASLRLVSEVADARLAAAQARRNAPSPGARTAGKPSPSDAGAGAARREPSIAELRALLAHAGQRVALYRQRMYVGRGNPRRLAELERIAAGARGRLARALSRDGS